MDGKKLLRNLDYYKREYVRLTESNIILRNRIDTLMAENARLHQENDILQEIG